jgi:tRNA threonylcarbamoyladenosine biosynthesis protein TsaB
MITLALDASTYAGDVALLADARVVAESTTAMKGAHEERLMPTVARVLEEAGLSVGAIDRVVCGEGPGSFTSLRIAGAIAKGIATGTRRPLYAVPSMALIVGGTDLPPGRYVVAIDALRAEFYVGLYDVDARGSLVEVERAKLVAASDLERMADEYGARLVSPSAIVGGITASPRARAVARLDAMLDARGPVEIAGWEPSYGRLAEAQVRWESDHGRALPAG